MVDNGREVSEGKGLQRTPESRAVNGETRPPIPCGRHASKDVDPQDLGPAKLTCLVRISCHDKQSGSPRCRARYPFIFGAASSTDAPSQGRLAGQVHGAVLLAWRDAP